VFSSCFLYRIAGQLDAPAKDVEQSQVKLKYPRAIPFIISNEFCERFNFYGMKAILVLYLTRKLLYDDDTATVLYHTFNVLVYFFCIFGAILADSWQVENVRPDEGLIAKKN